MFSAEMNIFQTSVEADITEDASVKPMHLLFISILAFQTSPEIASLFHSDITCILPLSPAIVIKGLLFCLLFFIHRKH